eukprot:UN02602
MRCIAVSSGSSLMLLVLFLLLSLSGNGHHSFIITFKRSIQGSPVFNCNPTIPSKRSRYISSIVCYFDIYNFVPKSNETAL